MFIEYGYELYIIICNEKRYPFNPLDPRSKRTLLVTRTRIIKIITDSIAYWQCLHENVIRSIRQIRVRLKVFAVPTEFSLEHGL